MRVFASLCRCLAVAAISFAAPASAHHTYVKKYDSAKKVSLSGTIEDVRFYNPHIFFTLQTAKGSWTIETESVAVAKAKGLSTAHLKSGAKASVTGWPARDGSAQLGLANISFAGGPSISIRATAR